MTWDIQTIRERRHLQRVPVPVIRINKDQTVKRYKSIRQAAFFNGVNASVIKTACEKGNKVNGFTFDYQ